MVCSWQEGPKWVCGAVARKLNAVSYEVDVGGNIWRRHANQLLGMGLPRPHLSIDVSTDDFTSSTPQPPTECPQDNSHSPVVKETNPSGGNDHLGMLQTNQ